jgi:hypothetical protein
MRLEGSAFRPNLSSCICMFNIGVSLLRTLVSPISAVIIPVSHLEENYNLPMRLQEVTRRSPRMN